MINGNTLKFGAGDICVDGGITVYGELKFCQIKPSQDVGTEVKVYGTEFIPPKIVFDKLVQIIDLRQKINQVIAGEYKIFDCDEFVFDFSSGDPKSIDVVKRHVDRVFEQIYILMSC